MTAILSAERLLLRDAELDGERRADVRIVDGAITEIGRELPRFRGEETIECGGGALLPGLVDHHIHLHATAAQRRSVPCGPPKVFNVGELANALAAAVPDNDGWIRGIGYHETVAGDLDSTTLDRIHRHRPVRIQHRSGAMWTVNTAAAEALSLATADHPGVERRSDGTPTGRLWRADAWLRSRLPLTPLPSLASVGRELAEFGITAVTDATPDLTSAALAAITAEMSSRALPQRVHLLGAPLEYPRCEGKIQPTIGPYKIVLADSGLPALDDLVARVREVHAAGRAVAVHVVTREALFLMLAANREAGHFPGDRLEHAALIPPEMIPEIAGNGLRVVTQPGFLADRGDDYVRDIPEDEHADLYRCRSLVTAGIPLALSSDAPYGPLDPWTVIAAAKNRRTRSGHILGTEETLTPEEALNSYLAAPDNPGGPPRRVQPGAPAELVLLHIGRKEALAEPNSSAVRTTIFSPPQCP